jgi:hypothetical protein
MTDELIRSFESTVRFVVQSVDDLSDEDMIRQPPGVPNHAMWTMGHIVHSCQGMATELGVEPWLHEEWESAFGYGSTPSPDGELYPGKAEMKALFADAAIRLCDAVRSADESTLGRTLPDEDFPTLGHILFQVVAAHTAYHAGQLAVWRRAMGKESVAVFV